MSGHRGETRAPEGAPPPPFDPCYAGLESTAVTIDEIRRRLDRARPSSPPSTDGMSAAVLLLLTGERASPKVLLTKRSQEVEHHKGEISFPGGVIENDDPSPLHAALRETEEEMGIPPSAVEVLGPLEETGTIASGFRIWPFAGALVRPVPYRPSPIEIEKVLEVPLSWLLTPAHERVEQVEWEGRPHPMYFFDWDGENIWGATARILHGFLERLR